MLRDITPQTLRCSLGHCPAVYKHTGDGTFVIIGKKVSPDLAQLLEGKVGPDEYVVQLSQDFFANVPELEK